MKKKYLAVLILIVLILLTLISVLYLGKMTNNDNLQNIYTIQKQCFNDVAIQKEIERCTKDGELTNFEYFSILKSVKDAQNDSNLSKKCAEINIKNIIIGK